MEGLLTSAEFYKSIDIIGVLFTLFCGVLILIFMGLYFKLSDILREIDYLKKYEIARLERDLERIQEDTRKIRYK